MGQLRTANLLVLVLAVLDTGQKDGGLIGEDQTVLGQVAVPSIEDGIHHALIEEEVSHPL